MNIFNRAKRRKERILNSWGVRKAHQSNQYYARQLHEHQAREGGIDEQSASDLDFDRLFSFLDRSTSVIGSQYLYQRLLRGDVTEAERRKLEADVAFYEKGDPYPSLAVLSKLKTEKDYIYPAILYGKVPQLPQKRQLVRAIQLLSFACLLFGFSYPVLWLTFVPLVMINLFLHYRIKQEMGLFIDVFTRLNVLYKVGEALIKVSHHEVKEKLKISGQLKRLKKYLRRLNFLKVDTSLNKFEGGNVMAYFLEVFKFATLLDVVTYYALLENLPDLRESVEGIYYAVGEADLALSVLALRGSLAYFSRPDLSGADRFTVHDLYHPLLDKPVANDLRLNTRGLLVTGSNMAGKSTFIKTVNVNALCAQTLNTAFATSYSSRPWRIATSINTQDDLSEGSSYYLQEVDRIGHLLRCSEDHETPYLLTIDEVFRGTNTVERISSAKAVLSYLSRHESLVLVSTHDLELAELLRDEFSLYHFQESVKNEELSFDYLLKPGVMTERNAIKILALAGYPGEVVREAEHLAGGE